MHNLISVTVPSRDRPICLHNMITSFYASVEKNIPHFHVIHDAPTKEPVTPSAYCVETINYDKSSLTELWNQGIIMAPTDWVMVCNDDIVFKKGWLEYLEEKISEGKHLLIHLFHYGAFCIHKSLILKVGWFDENFRGGGFEDIDHMLRIAEAGLKESVDRSHDFIRMENDVEVGHFIDHHKVKLHKQGITAGTGWDGKNNGPYIVEKWGRRDDCNWRRPSFRQFVETDWHPAVTKKYSEKFKMDSTTTLINLNSMGARRAIFP